MDIKACDTEWQAADHYNRIHSSIQMEYRCPACRARLVSFSAASDHIASNRTDQGHIDHGVHVQVGARHMVSIEPNRWYEPHGIDPTGLPFAYVRMDNVQRTLGWENQDQVARVYPVLVRTAAGKCWLLHGRAYQQRLWNLSLGHPGRSHL